MGAIIGLKTASNTTRRHLCYRPRYLSLSDLRMQFTPFISDIEIPFYSSLASLKLNHDKLDDSTRKILGLYELRPSDASEASCRMQIRGNALLTDEWVMLSLKRVSTYGLTVSRWAL